MATKLAGEVEGREKHDTSCLKGNRTTAPEGAEGLFSIHYPGPVKQTSEKGARDCPSEPRKMHKAQRMGHQFGALSTEKLFFFSSLEAHTRTDQTAVLHSKSKRFFP